MNIPLKVNNKKINIKELDDLNIDFWRHEVNKKGTYTPKKYISKKIKKFKNIKTKTKPKKTKKNKTK